MINRNILQQQLLNKFRTLSLHAVVNECFIKGLPFNIETMEKSETKELTKYSLAVLESLGGFGVLESAIESVTDVKRKMLLDDIYEICTEASTEAAKRISNETDVKNIKDSKEVVDSASFTPAEYASFIKKADTLDTNEISNVIQEKTKAVIRDEQEAYERDEKIEAELTDVLASSKNFATESVNSFMDLVLQKGDTRHHVSLFSKIQEAAYESINRYPAGTESLEFKIVNEVTFESFLDVFKSKDKNIVACLESMINAQKALECDDATQNVNGPQVSMLVSIIVYTMMETLKTLNLYCPDKTDVAKYVANSASAASLNSSDTKAFSTKCYEMIQNISNMDYSDKSGSELANIVVELTGIKETLATLVLNDSSFLNVRVDILDNLAKLIERIDAILAERSGKKTATESLSYYDKRQRESDTAQLTKIHNLFSKNPNVAEIKVMYSPANESGVFDIVATGATGQIVGESFITINNKITSKEFCGYVQESFTKSKLSESDKLVSICYQDGTGHKKILQK